MVTWTRVVKSFLQEVKNPRTIAGSMQTHAGPGSCLVTIHLELTSPSNLIGQTKTMIEYKKQQGYSILDIVQSIYTLLPGK